MFRRCVKRCGDSTVLAKLTTGMRVSAFVEGNTRVAPVYGTITSKVGEGTYSVQFVSPTETDATASTSSERYASLEIGAKVWATHDNKTRSGLLAQAHGDGTFAVLLDDDSFISVVGGDCISVSEVRPAFMGWDSFAEVSKWVRSAGITKTSDVEFTSCVLFHRGWRAPKLYLLQADDVECLKHLNKAGRLSLLERADWEKEQLRHEREMQREKNKDQEWRFFLAKYSGVFSSMIALSGIASVFMWNYRNWKKQTRAHQVQLAVASLRRPSFGPMLLGDYGYIARDGVEERLEPALRAKQGITIVTGTDGSGKSTVLRKVLQGKKGVLHVHVRPGERDVVKSTMKALGVTNIEVCGDAMSFLNEVFTSAVHDYGVQTPLIIYHLHKTSKSVVEAVYFDALTIAFDTAPVIIEASSSFLDPFVSLPRANLLTIHEFSEAEAISWLRHAIPTITDHDIEKYLTIVGTKLADLHDLVNRYQFMSQEKKPAASEEDRLATMVSNVVQEKLTAAEHLLTAHLAVFPESYDFIKELAEAQYEAGIPLGKSCRPMLSASEGAMRDLVHYDARTRMWSFNSRVLHSVASVALYSSLQERKVEGAKSMLTSPRKLFASSDQPFSFL